MASTFFRLLAVAAFLPLASCGGSNDPNVTTAAKRPSDEPAASETRPSARSRTAACRAARFEVAFVQSESVSITSGGRTLAKASYLDRDVSPRCVSAQIPRSGAAGGLNDGVYEDVRISCAAGESIVISVHPIRDGDNAMAVSGSSLAVYASAGDGTDVVLAAVLKNREQAAVASRLYYTPGYCKRG